MNSTVLFLKNIHLLAQKMSWIQNDSVIDELKDLFIQNSSLLNDDENTASFINELIYCAEKNVTPDDVDNLISHLNSFFIHYFSTLSCHVIFVGQDWHQYILNSVFLPCKIEKVTSFEIKLETGPETIQLNLEDDNLIPIVVTDHIGFNFLKNNNIQFPDVLTALQFPEKNRNRFSIDAGFIPLLNSRYEKLLNDPEVKTLILGSSYGYQGFPDKLLDKAVNLSLFSGDFTLSYSLIKKAVETTKIKNFIICIGLYDAFFELSMGGSPTFPIARYFCKSQHIEYNYRKKEAGSINTDTRPYITGPLDLLIQYIYKQQHHPQFDHDEELSWLHDLLLDMPNLSKSVDFINDRSYCTHFSYSSTEIHNRVVELSKNYQRKHSFENNKDVISSLLSLIEATNSTLTFIVMPFTEFYRQHYDQNLKNETLAFIKSVTNSTNIFMTDLSAHQSFTPEDYYDADHLNFYGATKLCKIVRELGLEI